MLCAFFELNFIHAYIWFLFLNLLQTQILIKERQNANDTWQVLRRIANMSRHHQERQNTRIVLRRKKKKVNLNSLLIFSIFWLKMRFSHKILQAVWNSLHVCPQKTSIRIFIPSILFCNAVQRNVLFCIK